MSAMYMLIAFSLTIATGFVIAFIWAINSGQYDDKYTPSVRILFDEDPKSENAESSTKDDLKKKKAVNFKAEPPKKNEF